MADNAPAPKTTLTKRQEFELLLAQLDVERSSFIASWRDLNDFISPSRARFQITDNNKGERRNLKIIDSSATFAARTLSSGMMSAISSAARKWFSMTTPYKELNDRSSVKAWLYDLTEQVRNVLLGSNFYNVLPVVYGDMGVFATGGMLVEEDDETVIRCDAMTIGRYYIANDYKGRVRTFARCFPMTVRRMAEKFGVEKLSPARRALYETGKGEQSVEVCHIITANRDYDPSKLESRFKRFVSCYYERGAQAAAAGQGEYDFLEEMGYDEFPCFFPRWSVTGEDVYGTDSPGWIALGDVKSLQTMRKRGAQAVEKKINPPMTGPSTLRTVKASILPGDITYDDSPGNTKGFRAAHETNIDLNDLRADQNDVRQLIRRAFYEDLFLMLAYADEQRGTQPVTAAEIAVRQQEKLLALGPMLERLNQDLFDPFFARVFAIMVRQGKIPAPPKELEGMPLKVDYESIMADAQKATGLAGVERFIGVVGGIAKLDPQVIDKVDLDQLVDEFGDMSGVPPRIIRDDDQVAAIREAKAKATAQAQQAELASKLAPAAKQLSETDTQQPSALRDLLDSGQGQ